MSQSLSLAEVEKRAKEVAPVFVDVSESDAESIFHLARIYAKYQDKSIMKPQPSPHVREKADCNSCK